MACVYTRLRLAAHCAHPSLSLLCHHPQTPIQHPNDDDKAETGRRWPTSNTSSAPFVKAPQVALSAKNLPHTSRTQPVISVHPISTGSINGAYSSPPM